MNSDWNCKCVEEDGSFCFYVGGDKLRTPAGRIVKTRNRILADRICKDVSLYGPDVRNHVQYSVLPYHFTYLDNFKSLGAKKVIAILRNSFLPENDWTYSLNSKTGDEHILQAAREWFGLQCERSKMIDQWIEKCTTIELTAACCIANSWFNLNVAYNMAKIHESNGAGLDDFVDLLKTIIFWHQEVWNGGGYQIVIDGTGVWDEEIAMIGSMRVMAERRKMSLVDYRLFDLYYGLSEDDI